MYCNDDVCECFGLNVVMTEMKMRCKGHGGEKGVFTCADVASSSATSMSPFVVHDLSPFTLPPRGAAPVLRLPFLLPLRTLEPLSCAGGILTEVVFKQRVLVVPRRTDLCSIVVAQTRQRERNAGNRTCTWYLDARLVLGTLKVSTHVHVDIVKEIVHAPHLSRRHQCGNHTGSWHWGQDVSMRFTSLVGILLASATAQAKGFKRFIVHSPDDAFAAREIRCVILPCTSRHSCTCCCARAQTHFLPLVHHVYPRRYTYLATGSLPQLLQCDNANGVACLDDARGDSQSPSEFIVLTTPGAAILEHPDLASAQFDELDAVTNGHAVRTSRLNGNPVILAVGAGKFGRLCEYGR